MADLLGSLLPTGYTAPAVQSALGGAVLASICNGGSSPPVRPCELFGILPIPDCLLFGAQP